jgi:hypothetical protein
LRHGCQLGKQEVLKHPAHYLQPWRESDLEEGLVEGQPKKRAHYLQPRRESDLEEGVVEGEPKRAHSAVSF